MLAADATSSDNPRMSYQVLARKWRPRTFKTLVGQEHVVRALVNGLDQDRVHHAFLFTGTRGVGKTTIARIFAKALNCLEGVSSEPCGECSACTAIDEGRFIDLLEVDAASRTKVEDTRELLDNVQYAPSQGRYKVYLIDEVHMLSTSSFNALLKTLEEPPPHVKFLLATTDPQKLPATVLSRCLQFNLKRLPIELIHGHLTHLLQEESIDFDNAALQLLAFAADGSMRDALSLLDQAIAFGQGTVHQAEVSTMLGSIDQGHITELLDTLAANDGPRLMATVARISEQAPDFYQLLGDLLTALQRLALIQMVPDAASDQWFGKDELQRLAGIMTAEDVQLFYQIALVGRRDFKLVADPRSGFEMLLLRMLSFTGATDAPAKPASPSGGQAAASAQAKTAAVPQAAAGVQGSPSPVSPSAASDSASAPPPEPVALAKAEPGTTLDHQNWRSVMDSLPLIGMARQLAANCQLIRHKENRLNMALAPNHAQICTPSAEAKLKKALEAYLGTSLKLSFTQQEPDQETPAQQVAREASERQQAAEQSIHGDPLVQNLMQSLGAEVVPNSVRPID